MQIHISAKFNHSEMKFHDSFEINATEQQIEEIKEKIINYAIKKFKDKCENHFKIEFSTMVFFEVYYFNSEAKEITIFKKEKI